MYGTDSLINCTLTTAPILADVKLGRVTIRAVTYSATATSTLLRANTSEPVLYSHARGLKLNSRAAAEAAPEL